MVATFHLHCLGHRVKYRNPEAGNTTQQFCQQHDQAAVLSLLNHFYFVTYFVTYYTGKFVNMFIYKLAILILFFVIFNCNVFLHCMLNISRYEKIFCEIDESIVSQHDP